MSYQFVEATAPTGLTDQEIIAQIEQWLAANPRPLKKVLILPPDITRYNSYAGQITVMLRNILKGVHVDIMPAIGTHMAMTGEEMDKMFPGVPHDLFLEHNWKTEVVRLGDVPADFVERVSDGWVKNAIHVEINRRLLDKSYDLIISVGQVVPHEVVGMANYSKNIFVGCGGSSLINGSHIVGALYGMESMMGRDHTPVHQIFDYAEQHYCMDIPLVYMLTVTAPNAQGTNVRSLAIGRDREMFSASIKVSQQYNLNFLDKPLKKVVAYLDPEEFRTTWVGNKSIYRTRMAIADGGELVVIAPGVHRFGEDMTNDALIRKFGYCGRKKVLEYIENDPDMAGSLSVAAHLIHGSSDGRFQITYAPGHLTREETEKACFTYMDVNEALAKYPVDKMQMGYNTVNGEEIYFVPNPALGLWAWRQKFDQSTK